MTVAELITHLQAVDPDRVVLLDTHHSDDSPDAVKVIAGQWNGLSYLAITDSTVEPRSHETQIDE